MCRLMPLHLSRSRERSDCARLRVGEIEDVAAGAFNAEDGDALELRFERGFFEPSVAEFADVEIEVPAGNGRVALVAGARVSSTIRAPIWSKSAAAVRNAAAAASSSPHSRKAWPSSVPVVAAS